MRLQEEAVLEGRGFEQQRHLVPLPEMHCMREHLQQVPATASCDSRPSLQRPKRACLIFSVLKGLTLSGMAGSTVEHIS